MTTLRDRLTAAGISAAAQVAHLEAGHLAVGRRRVTDLDTEIPDDSWDFGIYPWPAMTDDERAAVEAELAAARQARTEAEQKKSAPSGW